MLRLLKIYIFINVYFVLSKCIIPGQNSDDLTVRIVDKKIIERKRQDTRDMCKIFNSEAIHANLPKETFSYNKYNNRKKELKLQEKKEELLKTKKKSRRNKRDVEAMSNVNPALNGEDEERVESIVDRIYDDLQEKGQKISYRRRGMPMVATQGNNSAANKNGRRFPFAPLSIDGPTSKKPRVKQVELISKPVRFVHGIVPYFIDSKSYDSHLVDVISKAFEYFEKATCIRLQRLRERPTDQQSLQNVVWLYITNPSGIRQCVHTNERAEIKGVQMIVFGYDCMSQGDIAHEIMHVLGFAHEHVRPDRDQYITVLWDNIKPGYRKYFEVHDKTMVESLPYDYASVLHYPPRAFSRNGQVTIMTEPGIKIGQREGLSEMDVEKIGMMYSYECIKRTQEYLLQTCPSVVKADTSLKPITQQEIEDYFEDRLWPYGVVNYKLRDMMEFSSEERENIKAVIRHIEKETCIEFRDLTDTKLATPDDDDNKSSDYNFESDYVERLVILTGPSKNKTKAILPDSSTSDEDKPSLKTIKKENVKMSNSTKKKGFDNSNGTVNNVVNIEFKKMNANISTKEVNVTIAANEKNDNLSAIKKNASLGAKEKIASIGTKEKNANVIRQQSVLRRKRAAPASPSRRHATSILVLTRSPQPGCHCPQPGKPDGTYVLKINSDCFNSVNDLLHLFVHLLGLDHQHNMHDRDSYLHILWDQLSEEIKQEMKMKLPPAAAVGFPYDYQSVMHYPWLQIKNGKTNIMYPIWNDGWAMGHWQGLSSTDVQKINLLYFKQCMQRRQQAEATTQPDQQPKTE